MSTITNMFFEPEINVYVILNKPIRVIGEIHGRHSFPWFCGVDIATLIGYSDTRKPIIDIVPISERTTLRNLIRLKPMSKNDETIPYVTRKGLEVLLVRTRLNVPKELIETFKLDIRIIIPYKQTYWNNIIKQVFGSNYDIYEEYVIGKYRADMYIPSMSLVIECDENGHSSYSKEDERERQEYILSFLGTNGCLIRFNPDNEYFEIGLLVELINSIAYNVPYCNYSKAQTACIVCIKASTIYNINE